MVEYRPMVDNIDPVASLWMREWITPWIMIKLYHYNGTKLKDFYMGPSVKFVLPIIDAFPDKKNTAKLYSDALVWSAVSIDWLDWSIVF